MSNIFRDFLVKQKPIFTGIARGVGGFGFGGGGSVFEASGGTVTTSGDYTYHTFTAPGTFTVVGSGPVEMAVIGGGGGGGGADGSNGPDKGKPGGSGGGAIVRVLVTEGDYTITIGGGGLNGTSTVDRQPDSPATYPHGGSGGTNGGGQGRGGNDNQGSGGGGGGFSSVYGNGAYYAVGGGGAGGGNKKAPDSYGGGDPNNSYISNSTSGTSLPQISPAPTASTPVASVRFVGGGGGGVNGSGGGGGLATPGTPESPISDPSIQSGGSNYAIPTAISSTLYAGVSSGPSSIMNGTPGAPGILSSPNWSPVMTTGVGAYGSSRYPGSGQDGRVSIRFLTSQLTD